MELKNAGYNLDIAEFPVYGSVPEVTHGIFIKGVFLRLHMVYL